MVQTTFRRLVRLGFAAMLAAPIATLAAPEKFLALRPKMTVNDFALQCQHPAMKSEPDARFAGCISYVVAVVEQAAVVKPSAACKRSVSERIFPGAIMDALFHLATQPDSRNMPLADAAREIVLVAHKACE